jgi:hypothetical protein
MIVQISADKIFHSSYDARRDFDYTKLDRCIKEKMIVFSGMRTTGPHAQEIFGYSSQTYQEASSRWGLA